MPPQKDTLFKASLLTLTFMILGMVVIGGLTRLTGSGLSIVEWKPVTGIFPPLTLQEWMLEFNKYQQTPEFQKVNFLMSLQEFQSIFWLEYLHRLWGRLLGAVILIPTLLMLVKKQHRELWFSLVLLWGLGLAQGLMGWLMVKSGLIQDPHVSPYRLALHLFLGFAIFGVALWTTLTLFVPVIASPSPRRRGIGRGNPGYQLLSGLLRRNFVPPRNDVKKMSFLSKTQATLKKLTVAALFLVLITAFLGALVAGLRAGLLYNTFPFMGERLIPHEFLARSPWWKDLFENPASVQFLHRICAMGTVLLCGSLWVYQRKLLIPQPLKWAFTGVVAAASFQFLLGVLTLLLVVPVGLATVHQAFAFILFGSLLYALFLMPSK